MVAVKMIFYLRKLRLIYQPRRFQSSEKFMKKGKPHHALQNTQSVDNKIRL